MSWYVEQLILNERNIRKSIESLVVAIPSINIFTDFEPDDFMIETHLDDDTYSDLLSVLITADKMMKNNLVTDRDRDVFELIQKEELSFQSVGDKLGISRVTISIIFKAICDRIAFLLGDHFTNEGYIEYLSEKYSLSDEEIEILMDKIN